VRHRTPWYESENPSTVARGAGWRLFVIVACALAAVGLLGAIGWGISVALSGPKGAGDVHRQNQGAQNRIYAQAHFQDLYGDIQSYKVQINQAAKDKAEHPGDSYYATTYTGLFNTCVSAVNQYNADTGKALFTDWKSVNLPDHLDASVCEPTNPTPTNS
jgi:hypothetical protein